MKRGHIHIEIIPLPSDLEWVTERAEALQRNGMSLERATREAAAESEIRIRRRLQNDQHDRLRRTA